MYDNNQPEHLYTYERFAKYKYEDIITLNFYKSTGFDDFEKIPLSMENKEKLYNSLLKYEHDPYTSSHYSSTREYKIEVMFSDNTSWNIALLPQNYNHIVVLLDNDRYSPNELLVWLKSNNF